MHISSNEINVLGQILQTGWGKASSPDHITASIQGDTITLKYMTIVYFAEERALRAQSEMVSGESIDKLAKCVKNLKEQFKDGTGKSLKLKEIKNVDSVELIAATNLSPRKVAYYRRHVTLQIV